MVHCKLCIDIEEHRKFAIYLYLLELVTCLIKTNRHFARNLIGTTINAALLQKLTVVEVTLEKVYHSKLKFTIVNGTVSVTGIFQFTMVNFTLVNIHDYRGKNKDDPSPITIWLPKKIGGYISSLSKLCLFCWQFVMIFEESSIKKALITE